jgi:NAD-dependent deacetylase
MFGEFLPVGALERAEQLVRTAGMLLVVGSSLEVYPVAALPDEALAAGASLAIVNQAPTPYDGLAEVKVDGPAGATLAGLAEALATL